MTPAPARERACVRCPLGSRCGRHAGTWFGFTSPALLDELSGVLARPKFAQPAREGRAVDFVEALRAGATLVEDAPGEEGITRDPKDNYLVRLARAPHATALVSGDRDPLEAGLEDVEV